MNTNQRYIYSILVLMLLSSNKVFACDDLLPSDPSQYQVPRMNTGEVTGLGGIIDFGANYDDCTLECQCVYNSKKSLWEVKVASKHVCVFMRQCAHCKSTDKECEIRFVVRQSSSLYKQTFYANDSHKVKTERCYQESSKPVKCEDIANLPGYKTVYPLSTQ